MASHREKQYYYVLLAVGVFLVLASLWILLDYENAFITVISFVLSSIGGFLVGALISAALGYTLGIRYNPRQRFFTIDFKFTKKWFSTSFTVFTIVFGVLLTLIITSSDLMDVFTSDLYNYFVEIGVVQSTILSAAIGLISGGLLIYFTFNHLSPRQ